MRIISRINPKIYSLLKLALTLLFLTLGCEGQTGPGQKNAFLSIDLRFDFQSDSVKVELDDQVVFNGNITTDWTVSNAKRLIQTVSHDSHRVEVFILNHDTHRDTIFSMQDTITVDVRYDRAKNKLSFLIYNRFVRYD